LILFFSGPLVRAAEPLHDNPANHHTRRRRGERKKTKLYIEPRTRTEPQGRPLKQKPGGKNEPFKRPLH